MNIFTSELGTWSTTARYEQRSIPHGARTARGIAMSMLPTAVAACSSAICEGDGKRERATATPRNSRVSGLPISSGFPMTHVDVA
ncbi:hypothetical protein XH81_36710 [Bradyrhizobium sp. CCBAU 25360]|nr:hypothetical protein [Bradyrhizobium sp. CCBAU 25360]